MRVLISGYYGFGNLGDEALLSGIVSALKAAGHEVTVLSHDPTATERLHGVRAAHRLRGVLPSLLRCDAFISGGGGLLQDKTSTRSLQYYLTLLRLAKRLGRRTFVYGQSVGPLSDKGRRAVRAVLEGIPVAVRDERSRTLLASLGVEARLVADGALLLNPSAELESREGVLLVPRAGYPDITAALIHIAEGLGERGVPVAAAAVQPGEDAEALNELKRVVPGVQVHRAATPSELLSCIAGASYVVSGRLHGLILAAVAGRDFCGLVYDPKVAAFAEEVGAPAFSLPVDKAALLRCALERPPVPEQQVEALKARAQAGAAWLCERLEPLNATA